MGRDESMTEVSVLPAISKGKRDGLSDNDEASDEESEWEDHATDACALVARSARVVAIKDM